MKIVYKMSWVVALFFVFFQSCFPDFGNSKFTSFILYLYNNSSQKDCIADSVAVTFVIKNVSKVNSDEVRIDVAAADVKNVNIEGTKNEWIHVKLINAADSTLILEQEIKIGKTVYEGGDPAARKISYCNNTALDLTHFGQ